MPEREAIRGSDFCDLAVRWQVDPETMWRLVAAAEDYWRETRGVVELVSGFRTRAEQARLSKAGRPTAPDELSTHRSCPATGADVSLGFLPTRIQKAIWGRIVVMNGLRWGGGGAVDEGGIPFDWQHLDRGPR